MFLGRHFAHCDRHRELGFVNGSLGTVTGLCVHWLKFSYDRTQEYSCRKIRVEIGTGSRIPPPRTFSFRGACLHNRSRYLYQIRIVGRRWDSPTCGMLPSYIQDGGQRPSLIGKIAIIGRELSDFAKILYDDRYEGVPGQRPSRVTLQHTIAPSPLALTSPDLRTPPC